MIVKEQASYVTDFNRLEGSLTAPDRPAVRRLRKSAIARFDEIGFPGPRAEDWKFTSVAPIARTPFRPAPNAEAHGLSLADLPEEAGPREKNRLVFVNGHLARDLSSLTTVPTGVTLTGLAEALAVSPDAIEAHLGRHARFEDHPFVALNTAFFADGAFLHVPAGKVVEEPIHLVFLSTAPEEATVSHPRNLIVAERGSQLTLVERHVGLAEANYFTNGVTEVVVGDGAHLDHYKVQQEGPAAYHVAVTQVYQGRDSRFSTHFVGFGGSLVRNEVRVLLDAEGSEATVNGLYLASGTQHMDNHTVLDHAMPRCASHELYKGILSDRAHGVFNGKIYVRQDAQKTDAKQTNQTLLLSDDATINTKPQLEIYADDVKCTHGATVGQLDADALFYLRSRGIGIEQARGLLLFAFANDVIQRIRIDSLRESLERTLLATRDLPRFEEAEVSI
jgi:Fe-S cluster assembly protein SufD